MSPRGSAFLKEPLLLLELFTGLRHGEAIRLEWKNIDFKHKTILVEDTKNHQDHMLPMSTYLLATSLSDLS